MGSDGLFDNVFDEDIEKIVNQIVKDEGKRLGKISQELSKFAFKNSIDLNYESPF